MADKRKTIRDNIVCVNLVLFVGVLRLLCHSNSTISLNSITCLLYTMAIFIWMNQVKRRLIYEEEGKYLLWLGRMLIGLMLIRTIKFLFLPENHILVRYAWYLYYVPQTFMMLFMFFEALHIGRSFGEKIPRTYHWLYVPATILCVGIITNDFHQLAFRFDVPISMWQDASTYHHKILYYLSLVWIAVLFTAILVITIRRCAVSETRRKIWIPLLPLAIGVIYIVLFLCNPNGILARMYKTSEMLVIIFPAFMEGLIQAHLFPSNDNYDALWNVASIGGGIITEEGQICCCSKNSVPVTLDAVVQACKQDVILDDSKRILRSHPIQGGYGYWTKEVGTIWQLNKELAAIGDIITEENAILAGENRLKQQKEQVKQQNAIYDEIAVILKDKLGQLEKYIGAVYENETEFRNRMQYACVINVYLKRYSNLYLLSREADVLPIQELYLAIQESLTYIQYMDVKTYVDCSCKKDIRASELLTAYDFFQMIIEDVLCSCDAILAVITNEEKCWTLQLEIAAANIEVEKKRYENFLLHHNADLKIERDEKVLFLTLAFEQREGF